MTSPNIRRLSLAALMLGTMPVAATAQDCTLKLSAYEEATNSYTAKIGQLSRDLATLFDKYEDIDARIAKTPDACPADLSSESAAAQLIINQLDTAQTDQLLACGQSFNQRILTDIETARKSNDSQMVLRLGTVQQRIFAVETDAVEISKQAQFLEFRAKRLIKEYATLESRCSILGGIYD